jgi:hypothetical protein
MKVFVGMETSGEVRTAFHERGHHVVSCDRLPCDDPDRMKSQGPYTMHWQGDVFDVFHMLQSEHQHSFDLAILHPTCRYLSNAGSLRLYIDGKKSNGKDADRWDKMRGAADDFSRCLALDVPRLCVENPVMHGHAARLIGLPWTQTIQPYDFGADASKRTALWLKGLPPLQATDYVQPRIINGRKRWANQTDSGQNKLPPSADRWKLRSATYPGIAAAMADQWGSLLV